MLKSLFANLVRLVTTLNEILSAIGRDLYGLWLVFKIETRLRLNEKSNKVLDDLFERWVVAQPNKPCIIYNDQTWTYKDVGILYNIFIMFFNQQVFFNFISFPYSPTTTTTKR